MLTLFEPDGITPADTASVSLTTLEPDHTKALLLKNTSQQTISALMVALILPPDSAALATMTLSVNGRPVPVGSEEAGVTPVQVLDMPLPPGEGIPVQRHWKATSTAAQGLSQARLLLDVVS